MNPLNTVLPVEAELHQERAGALKTSSLLLEEAIGFWRTADPTVPGLRDFHRKTVEHRLWCLVVQREALGLFHHQDLWPTFGLPADVQPSPHLTVS